MSQPKYTQPLSPFWIYKWQYSMALSILHRVTGCALSVGMVLLVYWLVAAATGGEMYDDAVSFFRHPVIRIFLAGFSFAFFYHLANGVRHLAWDVGHGFEKKTARASGWLTFLGAIALTGFFWFLILTLGAPASGVPT
jgi:succinate dehydrogenase / fumarate reductase cytochrome b subunit